MIPFSYVPFLKISETNALKSISTFIWVGGRDSDNSIPIGD